MADGNFEKAALNFKRYFEKTDSLYGGIKGYDKVWHYFSLKGQKKYKEARELLMDYQENNSRKSWDRNIIDYCSGVKTWEPKLLAWCKRIEKQVFALRMEKARLKSISDAIDRKRKACGHAGDCSCK